MGGKTTVTNVDEEVEMGWLDKIMGRGKRTVGEATDSPTLKDEGRHQENAARADERADRYQEMAQDERERSTREEVEKEQSQ